MIAKKIILSIFAVFLMFSLVSASGELTLSNSSNSLVSVSPSSSAQFTFKLSNSVAENYSSLVWANVAQNLGSMTFAPTLASSINSGSNQTYTLSVAVPAGTSPGVYPLTLSVKNGTTESNVLTLNVNVTKVSSIALSKVRELTKTQTGKFTVTNNGNDAATVTLTSSGLSVSLSSTSFVLAKSESKDIEFNATTSSEFKFGSNSVTITATSNGAQTSLGFSLSQSFCKAGSVGSNLSLDNIDISSTGDEDDTWKALDKITIEVDVENNGNDDIDDVNVELALFDSNGNNLVNDLDFVSDDEEEVDLGNINDDDKETATFEFTVPADFESGDYKLAIKAYSQKSGESILCADSSGDLSDTLYDLISVEQEDDEGKYITYDNIKVSPSEATCGESVTLTADAYNIGDEDQDRVRVNLINSEFDLDQYYEIKSDLNSGDKERVSFIFTLPSDLSSKTYTLQLSADYDYKNGDYRESSEDEYEVPLKVIGCSVEQPSTGRTASITASLDSEAKAGEDVVVIATVENIGNTKQTFTIGVKGYDSWSSLKEVSDRTLTLEAGESQDVDLVFSVDKEISGEQDFTIEVSSNGKVESRQVTLDVEGSASSFSGFFSGGSTMIWTIGIINLVLIVLIIVIAVRLARK